MNLTVARFAELDPRKRVHAAAALIAPLESNVVELHWHGRRDRIDRAVLAVVPAHLEYRLRAMSPVTAVATLLVDEGVRRRACREYRGELDAPRFTALLAEPQVLPRTRWVDELLHRYVFEREVCGAHQTQAASFLEVELAKELFFLCKERQERRSRASVVHEEDALVVRARGFIEANLGAPLRIDALARSCHTSESTLLRAFRRELRQTPASYARERRLDAALLLVQSGRYTVGQVADRVGYHSLAAFTSAFHRRFGAPPSEMRRTGHALDVLPPEGSPARRKRRNV